MKVFSDFPSAPQRAGFAVLLALAAMACGNTTQESETADGGSVLDAGSVLEDARALEVCPAEPPAHQAPCENVVECDYDLGCTKPYAYCDGTQWKVMFAEKQGLSECPVTSPQLDTWCGCTPLTCYYGLCDGSFHGSAQSVTAYCNTSTGRWASTWSNTGPCKTSCGFGCANGEICVKSEAGDAEGECQPDPCRPEQALDCQCAASLCGEATCSIEDALNVVCSPTP